MGSGLMDLDEFEFLGPSTHHVMGLVTILTPVPQMYPSCGLLPPFGLWPGETTITCGHATEASLPPFELRGPAFLHPFDLMGSVMPAVRAVCLDQSWKFHQNPLFKYRCCRQFNHCIKI